jgi:lipopolysaccharide/colanic/teichoic acid biosynthesis glycosyltransferase
VKALIVLLDSRPAYLHGFRGPASLLLAPLGTTTVIRHLGDQLSSAGHPRVTIATDFEPDADYERRIRDSGVRVDGIVPAGDLAGRIADYEPSDRLVVIDPRCFPSQWLDPRTLALPNGQGPHPVRHLVALESHPGRTTERFQLNADGTVRRIQRYYDSTTWLVTSGVACSILPVSCMMGEGDLPFASLRDLRRSLAERGIPGNDIPIAGGAFDLSQERELLRLTERVVLDHFFGRPPTDDGWLEVGTGCTIHPTARLVGPVVLQDGVVIGPDATVVGPAVIGAGTRVEHDAMVAQCVVGQASVITAGLTVRHCAVFGAADEEAGSAAPPPVYELAPPVTVGSDDRPAARAGWSAVYPPLKAAFDVSAAALGLLALSPLLLLTAALVKLGSRGPVFYRDLREGKGGRLFGCLKFRTMVAGADAQQRELMAKNQMDGPQFKLTHDPRVTWLGRILRKLSVDELPQLINVVRLEMSLVGPRPSPFRENQLCIPWRDARLSVRPGITGLWQVCRHHRHQGDFHQWIHFDMLYVRHMSFLVDLKILAATVVGLGGQRPIPLTWILSRRALDEPH